MAETKNNMNSLEEEIKQRARLGLSASESIWLQLPEESDTEYSYFTEFMNLPKKGRTVLLAVNNYRIKHDAIPSHTVPGAWVVARREHHWDERVKAFDVFLESELKDYVERQQYLQLIEFQRTQMQVSQKVAHAANLLIERAITALENLDIGTIRPSTLSNYVKVAGDASRLSLDIGASALALDQILGKVIDAGELSDMAGFTNSDDLAKFEEESLDGIEGL